MSGVATIPGPGTRLTVKMPKETLSEFRRLARIETGPLLKQRGDGSACVVVRRMINEYIAAGGGVPARAAAEDEGSQAADVAG